MKNYQGGEIKIVDSKPIETKELVRVNRHKKRGESNILKEEESVGYAPLKKLYGYKITCISDGNLSNSIQCRYCKKA